MRIRISLNGLVAACVVKFVLYKLNPFRVESVTNYLSFITVTDCGGIGFCFAQRRKGAIKLRDLEE